MRYMWVALGLLGILFLYSSLSSSPASQEARAALKPELPGASIVSPASSEQAALSTPPKPGESSGARLQLQNLVSLFDEAASPPDLCRLRCEDLGSFMGRVEGYQTGRSRAQREDPAFVLASLLMQGSLGGGGREAFKMMLLFQDPSLLRVLAVRPRELLLWIAQIDTFLEDLNRREGQDKIADSFVSSLRLAAASCEERTWPDACQEIGQNLLAWWETELP